MLRRLLRRSFVRDTNGINNNHTLLVNSKRIESTSRRHHDNTIDFCVTYKHQRSFVSSSFLVSSLSNHFLPRKSVAAVSNRNHLFFVQRRQKQSSSILSSSSIIQIDPIVLDAIENGDPVVALESTIIAHGMPYPQNVHLSNTLNEILRKKGVQPATIGTYLIQNKFSTQQQSF